MAFKFELYLLCPFYRRRTNVQKKKHFYRHIAHEQCVDLMSEEVIEQKFNKKTERRYRSRVENCQGAYARIQDKSLKHKN